MINKVNRILKPFLKPIFLLALIFQISVKASEKQCSNFFLNAPKRLQTYLSAPVLTGVQYLHQKNPALYKSNPVRLTAKRIPQVSSLNTKGRVQHLENWLQHLEQLNQKASTDPEFLLRLKKGYHDLYVIKPENIPQSYYDLQVRITRERGQGTLSLTSDSKRILAETVISEQKTSLDLWVEYLSSTDAPYPMWVKYWTFSNMLKLSKWNPETQTFGSRDQTSTAPFIELNHEALSLVIDALIKKLNRTSPNETDADFLQYLKNENFGKLYGRALVLATLSPQEIVTTEGVWLENVFKRK